MLGLNKCNHKWKVLSECTTASKFEHAMNQLKNATGRSTIPGQMSCAERKHILVICCDECGKVIRYVEGI